MTQTETLQADVKALVQDIVLRAVEPDTPLIEAGLVDSVLAVEIVMAVEMQLGVRVPPTEIAEHLASVNALTAYIQSNR